MVDFIALDADDTLWYNERLYAVSQHALAEILSPYAPSELVEQKLLEMETGNLPLYGYGIKSFTLSMVETAFDISAGKIPASEIMKILNWAKNMLRAGVELLPGVEKVLQSLSMQYKLLVITKGDLLDQRSKLERSGIDHFFMDIEVVVEKTTQTYRDILKRHDIEPEDFLMVGNSLRSDILPVLAIGAAAVYIPAEITWEHELVDTDHPDGYHEIDSILHLPDLVASLNAGA